MIFHRNKQEIRRLIKIALFLLCPLVASSLCGDVKFDDVSETVYAITPVPGGVGAVTTSVLASHVVDAAEQMHKKEK